MTATEAQLEATRINVLLGNVGCSPATVTEWWAHCSYSELDGRTPLAAWLRGDYAQVKALVESLISRQFAEHLADDPTALKRMTESGDK
jgi:hypothetical protein